MPQTHRVREMRLPAGPSTTKLVVLVLCTKVSFALYTRASYDRDSLWYSLWCWCIKREDYREYKRYLVEDKIRSGDWWYLVKNLP